MAKSINACERLRTEIRSAHMLASSALLDLAAGITELQTHILPTSTSIIPDKSFESTLSICRTKHRHQLQSAMQLGSKGTGTQLAWIK